MSDDELIVLEVWNDNPVLADELIGTANVSLLSIRWGGVLLTTLDLYDQFHKVSGKLSLEITFTCSTPLN